MVVITINSGTFDRGLVNLVLSYSVETGLSNNFSSTLVTTFSTAGAALITQIRNQVINQLAERGEIVTAADILIVGELQ